MSETFYNILEVQENASIDEIKKSYRRLSMLFHPDKNINNPDATAKFQKLSEAYETIGDPEKKREYDATRNNPFFKMMGSQNHGSGANFGHGHNPMEDMLASLFGGLPFAHMQTFGPGQHPGNNINTFQNIINYSTQLLNKKIIDLNVNNHTTSVITNESSNNNKKITL